ncbi:transglycosylase domain-containing protein [Hamadaea tsunoensis]|uniref:transglycosylase domain-containing protein n=1 Tax=Hamadaea tsunoensis TaxID=53368 RepID=UPI00040159C3|nr:transglycosylase domain-containing protein [Hamadaea tsunoensis]
MSSYGDPNAGAGHWNEAGRDGAGYDGAGYDGGYGAAAPSSGRASAPQPGRGRAQVNRDDFGYQYDDDAGRPAASYDDYNNPGGGYGRPVGSASVGSASVGSASVPTSPASGSAPVGRASVGRAGVVSPGTAGRASVPAPGAGRAGVRPVDPDELDGPDRGPGGPGGPRGPRGRDGGSGGGKGAPRSKNAKKSRRIKIITASVAAFLILFGVGAIGGTYYFDTVDEYLPDAIPTAQTTAVMASDGKTQIAQLGTENRITVPMSIIPDQVRKALIAGEDKEFFDHHGISYSGILRAAWNNVTGGDKQGASTITQQYIKIATQQSQITYARKLREAVLARKLEDKYSKLEIMGFYLNTVDFGRGAVGIEKAAQAYFNKSAKDLTVPEAAVLGAVIKDPYGSGGAGGSPYDPEFHPDTAKVRWGYVLDNMVEKGWLPATDRAAMQFPVDKVRKAATVSTTAQWGIKINPGDPAGKATGNVINYVSQELSAQGISPDELRTGGYRVTTTIDMNAQKIVETAARPDLKTSQIYGRKVTKTQDLEAAAVMIDPSNGRVLGYYGGLDGTGTDLAGLNTGGAHGEFGGHAPGSSMKVYTLAAALEAGVSLQTRWKANPFTTEDGHKIGNAGYNNASCGNYCTLEYSFMKSFNVPFYWVARQIGPGKVVEMAEKAGVRTMWTTDGAPVDLTKDMQGAQDRAPFDREVGYGQYPITVLDHANGVATIANGGVYNKAHFVLKVEKKDITTGQYKIVTSAGEKLAPTATIRRQVANDVTYAMEKVFDDHGWPSIAGGHQIAAKTGTWEGATVKNGRVVASSDNAHAWVVGFTKQAALAVWTGNVLGETPVVDPKTNSTITSGSAPYRIWNQIFQGYTKGTDKLKLADPSHVGDDDSPLANGISPTPSLPVLPSGGTGDPNCIPLVTCPTTDPGGPQSPDPSASPRTSKSPRPGG